MFQGVFLRFSDFDLTQNQPFALVHDPVSVSLVQTAAVSIIIITRISRKRVILSFQQFLIFCSYMQRLTQSPCSQVSRKKQVTVALNPLNMRVLTSTRLGRLTQREHDTEWRVVSVFRVEWFFFLTFCITQL